MCESAVLMEILEQAGVRGVNLAVALHKAKMRGAIWSRDVVKGHLSFLYQNGVLLHSNGYYRLAKYADLPAWVA